jgi:hypothetical protein
MYDPNSTDFGGSIDMRELYEGFGMEIRAERVQTFDNSSSTATNMENMDNMDNMENMENMDNIDRVEVEQRKFENVPNQ